MDVLELVRRLEKHINAGDVDRLVELFSQDAKVVIPALSPKQGPDEIRALFDFCAGINVRWDFKESIAVETGAECRVDQFDGWSNLVGIAPLRYERFHVAASSGLIDAIDGSWSAHTNQQLGRLLEGFTPWATERRPDLYQANGDFVYTYEAGRQFIAAAREWLTSS